MIFGLLFGLLGLVSCRQESCEANPNQAALARIDSMFGARSPRVRPLIDSCLRSAADSMGIYEYTARLAKYYTLSSTPDSALPLLRRVERFARAHGGSERGRQLMAYAFNDHAAYYHIYHIHQDEQERLYRQAYWLLMQSKAKGEAHKVAANLGDAYAANNNLPKAAEWYRRALFLVDSLGLPQRENTTLYMGLASIYQQLGDNASALRYFQQTERNASSMTVGMQAYFLNNFGNYYYYNRNYSAALQKFLAMRRLLNCHGMTNTFDMYLCKENLADVYLNLGDTRKAASMLDEVEPYMKAHGDRIAQYYIRTIRIGIAVREKRWADVERLIAASGRNDGVPFQLRKIRARYLRQYYERRGDYRTAYNDLRADVAWNDSLEHNKTNMRTADIMARFSQDTLQLHNNLRLAEEEAKTQRTTILSVVALSVAAITVLLFLLYIQYGRKRYAEARMNIMDLKLQGIRNRISPHFVFNVLNTEVLSSADESKENRLLQLSKLIRENLDLSSRLTVSLEEELQFVEQYVRIERNLVGGDFSFSVRVDPGVRPQAVQLPSMLLQILVENAFVHGLSGWTGHKELCIDIQREGSAVWISVIDNGPGLNLAAMHGKERTGLYIIRQTVAAANMRSRQKMHFYMENVREDAEMKGCRSTITIPDGMVFKNRKKS